MLCDLDVEKRYSVALVCVCADGAAGRGLQVCAEQGHEGASGRGAEGGRGHQGQRAQPHEEVGGGQRQDRVLSHRSVFYSPTS